MSYTNAGPDRRDPTLIGDLLAELEHNRADRLAERARRRAELAAYRSTLAQRRRLGKTMAHARRLAELARQRDPGNR